MYVCMYVCMYVYVCSCILCDCFSECVCMHVLYRYVCVCWSVYAFSCPCMCIVVMNIYWMYV
jgi:hypothetical protein